MFAVSPGDGPGSLPRLGGQRTASAAEIEVTTTEGFYEIVFVTLAEDSSQVEAELQTLGLDVTVDFVPAPPSLEGHLVASEASEGADEVWEFTEPADFSGPAALHDPTGFTGALRLDVGRPAEDGEPFVSSAISALHPGEALHCTDVEGMTVAEATSVIAAAGVRVEFSNADDGTAYGTRVPSGASLAWLPSAQEARRHWVEPGAVRAPSLARSDSVAKDERRGPSTSIGRLRSLQHRC